MSDLEQIYISAVRYGLGRRTYITSVIVDFMQKEVLTKQCRAIMIKDIEECQDYGDNCDKESWMKLLEYLK